MRRPLASTIRPPEEAGTELEILFERVESKRSRDLGGRTNLVAATSFEARKKADPHTA